MKKTRGTSLGTLVLVTGLALSSQAWARNDCSEGFLNPQNGNPHNTANAAPVPFPLKQGLALGEVSYKLRDDPNTYTLEQYLAKFCTTGFLVLKEDQIVFERYLQGRKPGDSLLSASMSKTIFALLMGIAVKEGKLALDEHISAVLPDFKEGAFADDTVEDLLRMSSGAALFNSFEPGADSDNRAVNPLIYPRQDIREYLGRKKDRAAAPGTVFKYNGAQTALLGAALAQRVGGKNLTSYLQEKLWIPMGAEAKGYWIKNYHDEEGVQGQFAATLHDFARLGYLVMNQGRVNGKEVVPADWIAKMTELRTDRPQPSHPPYYGLHIWIPQAAGGRAMFWGVNGQNIFVDPVARVVIVHTGNGPRAEFDGNRHLFALRDAIARSLSAPR
ncbi:serine hydrolase [Duganella sp. Root336D2]|uniref:serine hydrolase domain-containing protein n=1 Tax=Duganella sp. Root336D2 TaxID=1736518 RepID=UPI0009EBC089|nr:serine hydrolase [Duganella sp. Root336D2]